jgi:hypothetical protein
MLRIRGCNGMAISDVKFEGAESGSEHPEVTFIAIEDLQDQPSLFNTFQRIALKSGECGIRASNSSGGDMVLDRVQLLNLGVGFKTTQPGNLCYFFRFLYVSEC